MSETRIILRPSNVGCSLDRLMRALSMVSCHSLSQKGIGVHLLRHVVAVGALSVRVGMAARLQMSVVHSGKLAAHFPT